MEFLKDLPDLVKTELLVLTGGLSGWVAFFTAKARAAKKKAESSEHDLKNTQQEAQAQAVSKRSEVMSELVDELQESIIKMQEELRTTYAKHAKAMSELTDRHNNEVQELKDEIKKLRKELSEFEARINQERRSLLTITAQLETAHRTIEEQKAEINALERQRNIQEAYLTEAQQHVDKYAIVVRSRERRKNLPRVELDEMEQELRFYGSSSPDNNYADSFYSYIEQLVQSYFQHHDTLRVQFSVSHLNSKSQALVRKFIVAVADIDTAKTVTMTWLYEEADDDMKELGKSFQDEAKKMRIEFTLQPVAQLHEAKFSL